MAPKIDQGTLIILDIGKNVGPIEETDKKSFFTEARDCTSKLIERNIMSQAKNYLGIMLMGSKKTNNSMAEQVPGAFRRIEILSQLQPPSWKMIRDLPEETTNKKGDWLEALVVAAHHFKSEHGETKITNKKIVLMTNFQIPTQLTSDVEQIIEGLKQDGLEVDIIGPDIYNEDPKGSDYELARLFLEATNGATAPFNETMQYLKFHKKRKVYPMPWNVDLNIGPRLRIPVSAYIRIKDEPAVKGWLKSIKDPVTLTSSTSEGIAKEKIHINTENQTTVEPTEVIKGYNYGQQIIPFNDCDKTMLYNSGDKSLTVYGFTQESNVTWQNLAGDGLSYIFGRKGNQKAQQALQCLVQCLHELKLVGIVRRVYNNGNAPKMYALMPVIDSNNFICLSMAAICFKEEIKMMYFPPTSLKKYNITEEHVNAFKELINAMDLTKAYDESYDDTEAFPVAETVSPSAQYVLDCIAFRAMNPGKPLPQPRDEIMQLFKQPPLVEKRSREPLEKIKKMFTLINKSDLKQKARKRSHADVDNVPIKADDQITSASTSNAITDIPKIHLPKKSYDITRITTADPINDYIDLKGKGKTLDILAPQIAEAIQHLIYCNLDGTYSKGFEVMKFFRDECVKSEPSHFNVWLKKFKLELVERKKDDVINLIDNKNLNFILKSENNLSTLDVNSSGDSQLYENDTIPNTSQLTIRSEVNDMFDDM